jgi:hypothetical protein
MREKQQDVVRERERQMVNSKDAHLPIGLSKGQALKNKHKQVDQ